MTATIAAGRQYLRSDRSWAVDGRDGSPLAQPQVLEIARRGLPAAAAQLGLTRGRFGRDAVTADHRAGHAGVGLPAHDRGGLERDDEHPGIAGQVQPGEGLLPARRGRGDRGRLQRERDDEHDRQGDEHHGGGLTPGRGRPGAGHVRSRRALFRTARFRRGRFRWDRVAGPPPRQVQGEREDHGGRAVRQQREAVRQALAQQRQSLQVVPGQQGAGIVQAVRDDGAAAEAEHLQHRERHGQRPDPQVAPEADRGDQQHDQHGPAEIGEVLDHPHRVAGQVMHRRLGVDQHSAGPVHEVAQAGYGNAPASRGCRARRAGRGTVPTAGTRTSPPGRRPRWPARSPPRGPGRAPRAGGRPPARRR